MSIFGFMLGLLMDILKRAWGVNASRSMDILKRAWGVNASRSMGAKHYGGAQIWCLPKTQFTPHALFKTATT